MMHFPASFRLMLLAAVLFILPACSSADEHVFRSTIDVPKTITIYDSMRKTELWSKAIPVEHRLVLDFEREGDVPLMKSSLKPAETMKWSLYATNQDDPVEEGVETMPGTPIIMKMTIRPAPEFPAPPAPVIPAEPATKPAPAPTTKAEAKAEPAVAETPAAVEPAATPEAVSEPVTETPAEIAAPEMPAPIPTEPAAPADPALTPDEIEPMK